MGAAPEACEESIVSKHTPRPWQTSIGHDARGYPYFYIHGMSGDQKRDVETLNANAQLIACAPDLAVALHQIAIGASVAHDGLAYSEIADIASKALAKAGL
jgi:hypothetical protein